ncbi:hypothetical protein ACO0LL_27245 [Undibacterium sp. TC4M20W]|uniref:hypothetical protein n=1 Tax=Undibacterium sp. TC4M20W TaxID=3413052 RepID=UPI003BF34A1C
MQNLTKLKNNVCTYLDYQSRDRLLLSQTLNTLVHCIPNTVIFGGMLREFALGNCRHFSSDIDIVSLASRKELYDIIKHFSPKQNKFGGYRFFSGKQLFDLWAFEDTWAFREGLIQATELGDIFKTTFFNLDAAAFHLSDREFLHSKDYSSALKNRLLDINLEENPAPTQMARRAVKMSIENNLHITSRLGVYILKNHDGMAANQFSRAYISSLKTHVETNYLENFQFNPQRCLL